MGAVLDSGRRIIPVLASPALHGALESFSVRLPFKFLVCDSFDWQFDLQSRERGRSLWVKVDLLELILTGFK